MKFLYVVPFLLLLSLSISALSGEKLIKKESITETWRYKWTQDGMLKKVVRSDKKHVDFTYDALGRRLTKTFKEQTTHFVWDGNVPLHEWTSSTEESNSTINEKGETEHRTPENLTTWIFEDGTFIPMAKLQGFKSYSIITDHLGTPVESYDEDGTKVWSRELNIYGETRKEFGEENFIPFLYQGQYLDIETELAYNRFRYYDCSTGLYLSQDPIRLLGNNPNMYAYTKDNNAFVDFFGLNSSCTIHRGTNNGLEISILNETGYLMSDAARKAYMEAMYSGSKMDDAIKKALKASQDAHADNIAHFGSLEKYMLAHSEKGTEIGGAAPRSLISFTTDQNVTSNFGNNVFSTTVSSDAVTKTVIEGGTESEVFVNHMIKII